VNQRHTQRLATLLERAKGENAEIVAGGKVDIADRFISPTVVRNVQLKSALMEDELFGPILPVITIQSIEEATDIINSRDKPLAAYIFSSNRGNINYVKEHTSSGGFGINDAVVQVGNLDLPFGGVGASGIGNYHGVRSFKLFSHQKAVLDKGYALDLSIRYPPYHPSTLKQLKFTRGIDIPANQLLFRIGSVGLLLLALIVGFSDVGKQQIIAPARIVLAGFLRTLLNMLE